MARSVARLVLLMVVLTASGCGADTYDERLKFNTTPFLRYQQELNRSLGSWWRAGELRIRLPAGFRELPAPKNNETRDRRIPPTLGDTDEWPGLLAGFRGELQALTMGGRTTAVPAYALVLSNRPLLVARDPKVRPHEFDRLLLNRISARLGQSVPPSRVLEVGKSGYHTHQGFAPQVRYETYAFETTSGDVPMRYEVYVRTQGQLQVAVVFVVPKEADRGERLRERIDLSLQTLRIDPGGATATAPSQTSPGSGTGPSF